MLTLINLSSQKTHMTRALWIISQNTYLCFNWDGQGGQLGQLKKIVLIYITKILGILDKRVGYDMFARFLQLVSEDYNFKAMFVHE